MAQEGEEGGGGFVPAAAEASVQLPLALLLSAVAPTTVKEPPRDPYAWTS